MAVIKKVVTRKKMDDVIPTDPVLLEEYKIESKKLVLRQKIINTLIDLNHYNQVTEILIPTKDQGDFSGKYDNWDSIVSDLTLHDGIHNILINLNQLKREFKGQCSNNLTADHQPASDADIERISYLNIDLNPHRPSGVPATNEEKQEAERLAERVELFLKEQGFPEVLKADSGNGYQLILPVDLKNTMENNNMLTKFLKYLDFRLSTNTAAVVNTTYKPSIRITLYGTVICNENSTEERPNRQSKLLYVPRDVESATVDQIKAVADRLPKVFEEMPKLEATKCNIPALIQKYQLDLDYEKIWLDKHRMFVLKTCPWNSEHNDSTSFLIQYENGAVIAGCHHSGCYGENWHTLKEKFGIGVDLKDDDRLGIAEDTTVPDELGIVEEAIVDDDPLNGLLTIEPLPEEIKEIQPISTTLTIEEPGEPNEKNEKNDKKEKKSTILLRSMDDCKVFLDQLEDPYALVPINGRREVIDMSDSRFKYAIMKRYYDKNTSTPGTEVLREATEMMRAAAIFSGEKLQLRYRIAYFEGSVYYDICSDKFNAIKIDKSGCHIVEKPPIVFKRKKTMLEQIMPDFNAQSVQLLVLVKKHFRFKTESESFLFAVYLVSCFLNEIHHIILLLQGSKGSSKSTTMKMIKKIIDPSATDILGMPTCDDDLKLTLAKNYISCFDNLSQLSVEKSNILCMSSTGGNMMTRKKYSDGEEFILNIKHCVILNGINFVPTASDLLDRSIQLELQRIPKKERLTDEKLWKSFDQDLPLFLGAIFNTLSAAMSIHENVELEELPRMGDFATWGFAIAEAMGLQGEQFLKTYEQNRIKVNDDVLKINPVGASMVAFVKKHNSWTSSVTEFFDELKIVAQEERINTNSKDWPKAANVLSRKLGEIQSNLEDVGIFFHTRLATNYTEITIEVRNNEENSENQSSQPELMLLSDLA